MPFRALIRTVDPDGNFKVGLDELALYFLRSRGWLKKHPQLDASGERLEPVSEHHNEEGGDEYGPHDADVNSGDISYAEMVAESLDNMLMGVLDEVVGLLPRRGAIDLGYDRDAIVNSDAMDDHGKGFGAGSSSSGSRRVDEQIDEEDDEDDETVRAQPRRSLWRQLGMIGAAALGIITASTRY